MLKLEKMVLNLFGENTYIIWDDSSNEAMIIDPGCGDNEEEKMLTDFLEDRDLKVKYLLNTHAHIDHLLGNQFILSKYRPKYLAAEEDVFLLEKMQQQAEAFRLIAKQSPPPDEFLKDNGIINFAGNEVVSLHTPGHSPGGYCFYFKNSNICITGDTLFREGIGRTDLWGGDYDTLLKSIRIKLFSLTDDVIIYPGHGEPSSIGFEKENNPFLKMF